MTVAVERQSPSFNIPRAHHHHHNRHKPPHARVLMFFLRHLFRVDGQRAAQERCLASQRATTALVVATRAAVDRHGPGICDASQRAAARRSTLHEDSHQGRGGGGLRAAPRLTGTEDSTSGDAAGASASRVGCGISVPSRWCAVPFHAGLGWQGWPSWWTPPPSASSRLLRWRPRGRRKRRRKMQADMDAAILWDQVLEPKTSSSCRADRFGKSGSLRALGVWSPSECWV